MNQLLPKKERIKPACKRWGLSVYSVRKLITDGLISYTKIGNAFYIDTAELQQYIESNTHMN